MEDSLSLERVRFVFTTKFCAKVKAFLGHEYSWTHFLSLSCEVETNQHVLISYLFKSTSKLLLFLVFWLSKLEGVRLELNTC
jgi:hypothetical protein